MEFKKDELIGYNLSITFRLGKHLFDKKMKKFGLLHSQFILIISLYEENGLSQEELSSRVNLDKTSISRAIKKLIIDGYVIKKPCVKDNRINRIFLTEKTLKMKEEIISIIGEINKKLTEGIEEEEIKMTISTLRKLRENIKKEIELDLIELKESL